MHPSYTRDNREFLVFLNKKKHIISQKNSYFFDKNKRTIVKVNFVDLTDFSLVCTSNTAYMNKKRIKKQLAKSSIDDNHLYQFVFLSI